MASESTYCTTQHVPLGQEEISASTNPGNLKHTRKSLDFGRNHLISA